MDLEAVCDVIKLAESRELAPRFRNLAAGDVEEKSPGELVTSADRACEELLTSLLRDLSDVPVIGEEAAAADPSLPSLIESCPAVWLVDPLDGTSNFAVGSPHYSVMVAYIEDGTTTSSWMWNPSTQEMSVASLGAGSYVNGNRVGVADAPQPLAELRGVVKERFLPDEVKEKVRVNEQHFAPFQPGRGCAGVE